MTINGDVVVLLLLLLHCVHATSNIIAGLCRE